MTQLPDKLAFTVREVAQILGFSTNSIYSFLKEGRIQAERMGRGRFRIPRAELEKFLGHSQHETPTASSSWPEEKPGSAGAMADRRKKQPLETETIETMAETALDTVTERAEEPLAKILAGADTQEIKPHFFDWFLGLLFLTLGVAWLLVPASGATFFELPLLTRIVAAVLLVSGLGVLWSDVRGAQHEVLGVAAKLLGFISLAAGCLPFYISLGDPLGMTGTALLAGAVLLHMLFPGLSSEKLLLGLVGALWLGVGLVWIFVFPPRNPWLSFFLLSVWLVFFSVCLFRARESRGLVFKTTVWGATFFFLVGAVWSVLEGRVDYAGPLLVVGTLMSLLPWTERFEHVPVRRQALVSGVFLWAAVLLAGIVVSTQLIFHQAEETYLKDAGQAARAAKKEVAAMVQEARLATDVVSRELKTLSDQNDEALPALYAAAVRKAYEQTDGHVAQVFFTDSRGVSGARYPIGNPEAFELDVVQALLTEVLRRGAGIFPEPLYPGERKRPVLIVTAPVMGAHGTVLGAVAATVDMRQLSSALETTSFRESGTIVALDTNDIYVVHPDQSLIGTARTSDRSDFQLQAEEHVPEVGWTVLASVPRSAALKSSTSLILLTLLVLLGGLALSLLAAVRVLKYKLRAFIPEAPHHNPTNSGAGFTPIGVLLGFSLSALVVGSGVWSTHEYTEWRKITAEDLRREIAALPGFISEAQLAQADVSGRVLGVVASGSEYAAYQVEESVIHAGALAADTTIVFPDASKGRLPPDNIQLEQFVLRDGTRLEASIVDASITVLRLADGRKLAARVIESVIRDGRLQGEISLQLFDALYVLVGELSDEGHLIRVALEQGGQPVSDVARVVAKAALQDTPSDSISQPTGAAEVVASTADQSTARGTDEQGQEKILEKPENAVAGMHGEENFGQVLGEQIAATPYALVGPGGEPVVNYHPERGTWTLGGLSVIQPDSPKTIVQRAGVQAVESDSPELSVTTESGVATLTFTAAEVPVSDLGQGSVASYHIKNETITDADIASDADIDDTKLDTINEPDKVHADAIQLSDTGGLVSDSGLSLLRTCSVDHVLSWDGDAWVCAAQSGSGGTTYTAGNDLDLTGTEFSLESTLDIVSTINLAGAGTLNGLDVIDATTENTLESNLDIAGDISGTGLANVTIGADKVLESHLKAVNAPTDELCLSYEATGGDFEWQSCGSGGGGSSVWSDLTSPSGNLGLSMAEYTSAFTYNTADTAGLTDAFTLALTNDASTDSATQRLLVLKNNSATGGTTDTLLAIENADNSTVTTGIQIGGSSTGSISNAIDVSDPEIVNALLLGANAVAGTNATFNIIDATTLAQTFGVNSAGTVTIGDNQSYTGIGAVTLASASGSGLILNAGGAAGTTLTIDSSDTTLSATGLATITSANALSLNPTSGATYTLGSTATTANLFNSTTTSLNIGAAATTVSLGASSGTTTVNNNLTVNGTAVTLAGNSTILDMTGTGTLGINTTTNRAITTGTGLFTTGGNVTVAGTGGLAFSGTGGDVTFAFGEKIDNDTDGTLNLTASTLELTGVGTVHSNQSTVNLLNTTATTVNFAGGATTGLTIGSTTTGVNTFNADVDMNFANGENLLIDTASGARTASALTFVEDNTTGSVPTIQWDSAETRGGLLDANVTGALGTENFIDVTTSAAFTSNILDVNIGANAATGDVVNLSMGSNALSAGAFVIADAGGARTDAIIDINSASTGDGTDASALFQINAAGALLANSNIFDINATAAGASNALDITYSSAANTGNAIDITMGTNAAGDGLNITSSSTTTGNALDIVATTPGADIVSINGGTSSTANTDALLLTFGTSNASGDVVHITPTYAGGLSDGLTFNIIEADAFSPSNASGTDTVNGLKFGNLTDPGSTITSNGINIGTGWDRDIAFASTTATIALTSSDGLLQITDGTTTLLTIDDVGSAANISTTGITTIGDGTGNDHLSFLEEGSSPSCAAGEYKLWVLSGAGENKFKKCQNGALSDMDAAGAWNAITAPTDNLSLDHQAFTTAFDWTSTGTGGINAFTFGLTDNATSGTQQGVRIINRANSSASGDDNVEALLLLDNADTSTGDSKIVDNALSITVSGGISNGITDAVDASDSNILNGLNIGANNLAFADGSSFNITDNASSPTTQFTFKDNTNALGGGVLTFARPKTDTGDPATCSEGDIYYNDADDTLKICHESNVWEQLDDQQSARIQEAGSVTIGTAITTLSTIAITPTTINNEVWVAGTFRYTISGGAATGSTIVTGRIFRSNNCTGTQVGTDIIGDSAAGGATTERYMTMSFVDKGLATKSSTSYSLCALRTDAGVSPPTAAAVGRSLVLSEITSDLGADVAEVYYSNDKTITSGEVVSIDSSMTAGVKRSAKAYEKDLLGIVSTKPGQVLSDGSDSGTPVLVALAGRVPVKVSAENGKVKAGDYVTTSSTPGVAMRATKAGPVLGQALNDADGTGSGTVLVYVRTGYYAGTLAGLLPEGLTIDGSDQSNITSSDRSKVMLAQLSAQLLQTSESADLASGDVSEVLTDTLMAGLEIITPKVTAQELSVDSIQTANSGDVAIHLTDDGKFIITDSEATGPAAATFDTFGNATFAGVVTAGTIRAERIEGLEIFTNSIRELSAAQAELAGAVANDQTASDSFREESVKTTLRQLEVAGLALSDPSVRIGDGLLLALRESESIFTAPPTYEYRDYLVAGVELIAPGVTTERLATKEITGLDDGDVTVSLADQSRFVVKKKDATEEAAAIDANGNATFAGVVTAKRFDGEVAGLDAFGQRIDELSGQVNGLTRGSDATEQATVSERHFEFSSEAVDIKTFANLVVTGSLIVNAPAQFNQAVWFADAIEFAGRPTFNSDTGGKAVMAEGSDQVKVTFDTPYEQSPQVSAELVFGDLSDKEAGVVFANNYQHVVTHRSIDGFTIRLNQKAEQELTFSWTALAVRGAQTTHGDTPVAADEVTHTETSHTETSQSVSKKSSASPASKTNQSSGEARSSAEPAPVSPSQEPAVDTESPLEQSPSASNASAPTSPAPSELSENML